MARYSSVEERKQRAEALKNARNQRYAYNDYLKAVEEQSLEIRKAQTIAELQRKQEAKNRENANFFVRALSTVGDLAANVVTGALKGLEGIYDLGAGIVGAVGGIFSSDFQNSVKDHIAYDIVGENIGNPLQELTKYSYTNDGGFGQTLENIASGVGQMLPAVAVNLIPGAGQAASMAMFASMAAGNATEEAYQDGASYWGGLGYGIASGAVEVATEKMFGGATKNIFGKGYLDDLTKNVAKSGLAKVAKNAVEEGLEEATSELVNPLLKNIYKDKGFFEDFLTTEHLKNIGNAALVGAGTSLVYGETLGRIGRRAANIQESINDLDGLAQKEENLWAKNDFSQDEKISNLRTELYNNISKELTTAKPQARERLLSKLNNYGFEGVFNADGSVVTQTIETSQKGSNSGVASYNREAYTPSLRGKEQSLTYAPTSAALTEAQIEAKKVFNALNKGKIRSNFVYTNKSLGKDSNGKARTSVYKDGTLYVSTKANAAQAVVEYEMTHTLEGTKAYQKYAEFILTEISSNEALKEKYGDVEALYQDTVNAYTDKLVKKALKQGQQELSKEAIGKIEEAASASSLTEIVARYTSENIFTNTEQILKLAEQEPSLLKKIANWVKNKSKKLSSGTAEQVEVSKFLSKAERLYKDALEASFGGAGIDNQVRDVYNIKKGDSENEQRDTRLHNNQEQTRQENENTSGETGRLQEVSRESGRESESRVQKTTERKYGYKEEVILNTKIKSVKSRLDYTDAELKVYQDNKKLGLNTVFYEGSAQPLTMEAVEDGGFDGFIDIKNKTVYLRSDGTISAEILAEDNLHEKTHYIFDNARESYNKLHDTIFSQLTAKSKDSLLDLYEDYFEVYKNDMARVHEEIVVDLVIGRETAEFTDVKVVNKAINDFYSEYNSNNSLELEIPSVTNNPVAKFVVNKVAHDSEGNPLSKAQERYFKDSKVRDADGNLLMVYHGTPNTFNIFNKGQYGSLYGAGLYFTEDIKYAEGFTQGSSQGRVIEAYLNIKNPLVVKNSEELNKYLNELAYDTVDENGIKYKQRKANFDAMTELSKLYDGIIVEQPQVDIQTMRYGKIYVALDSNQVKETTNINPTISEDIRYVINKNKEVKDLVVLHNISERKLKDAIKLGGLAVPSIAVTTDSIGHENFGDITLVFDKETINPADRRNEVYASDVYSKRFPKMINIVEDKAVREVKDLFRESAKELGDTVNGIYFEEMSLSEMVNELTRESFVQMKFLRDKGIEFEVVKKAFSADDTEILAYEWIIENNVLEELENLRRNNLDDWDYIDKIKPEISKKLAEAYMNIYENYSIDDGAPAFKQRIKESWKKKAETIAEDIGFGQIDGILRRAAEYKAKKGTLVIDEVATRDNLRNATKNLENELNNYVYDILSKYDKGSYVRNDVDPFDRYGNRKPFSKLYTKVSLENLVSYMRGSVRDSEGFNYGVGNIRSLLAKQFKSLQEIKESKNKLISEEEMKKLKDASSAAFEAIAGSIHEDFFVANDMVRDIAAGSMSEYSIKVIFKEYGRPEPSAETIGAIKEFLDTLKDYPTQYFEAKPQRAVAFEEVKYVIAPYGTDSSIIQYFENLGIEVKQYGDNTTTRSQTLKSLPEDIKFVISKGLQKKNDAKNTRMKVYSKIEAEKAINNILSDSHTSSAVFKSLAGAKKSEIVEKLWIALNTKDEGYRAGIALQIADYIVENAVAEDIYESGVNEDDIYIVNTIREYMHSFDLDSIKGEIKYRYDKDNSPFLIWGKRKGDSGFGADQIGQELNERGIKIEAINEAEIFFEIVDTYKSALSRIKKTTKQNIKDLASEEEVKQLKQEIAREVLFAYDRYGSKTKFSQVIEKYQKKIAFLTEQLKDTRERNKVINNLFETVDRVKALEKYKAADVELAPEVTKFIGLLKKIKTWRGNLANNIREIMNTYRQEVDGKKLYELIGNEADGIKNPTAQLIEDIANKRGELTTTELKNLDLILRNFIHNVKNYDRVFFEGRNQSDTEIVQQAIKETQKAIKTKDEGFLGGLGKFTRWLQNPVWRFERLGSYRKNSVMAKVFRELQAGNDKKALFRKQVYKHYEEFFKTNKKLLKEWRNQTIEIDGVKMSKGQMISLYMLSLRKQAQSHLFSNEAQDAGVVRVSNEKYAAKHEFRSALTKGEDFNITLETITKIENQLTDVDKQYIELTRKFFDEIARNAKSETDMALFGISNVGEENYIPIRVADDQIYKQLGNESMNFNDLFSVYSPSFNKDVKPNSKNKIVVENILDIVNRHASQMAAYYGLAIPVKSFNRIFNKKLEDGSKLRTEIGKVDSDFEKYVGKLLADLQGNIKERSGVDKLVSKLRGWGARASLGLNLKVLATQFVSLPAASAVGVKYKNLMKGFGMAIARKTDFDTLTTYAPMLWERFNEGSTVDVGLLKEGAGILGKIDMWTDITTAPIGKIDQFICGAVWNACLEQTKNSSQYENYSEEHYKAAAKLTEEAVIKTQANYTALYRPAILREQSSFMQLSTMFMSEPLQQFSLLTSAIDKIRVAKLQLKSADAESRAEAEALLKTARAEATRAIATVVVDTIILTLIAQAFRWIKGQDDEEERVQSIIQDFAENYIGMLPFVKDVYSYLNGFDVTNYVSSGLTNIGQSLQDLTSIIDLLASGKAYDEAEVYGKLRKTLLAISQTFGIPIRNLETYCKGIIEKFSPSAVYKYEKFFYDGTTSSYMEDLTKAIEDGDEKLADTIIDSFLTEEKIPVKDKELRETLKELYSQGYSVFPKSVGTSITYSVGEGEEREEFKINLTTGQRARFRSVYQEANTYIKKMVNTQAFKDSEAEIQAKSIKAIYDYYYDLALEDLTGEDMVSEKDKLFYSAIPIEKLALIIKTARAFESDKDDNGKTISGSKKKKVQQYVANLELTAAEKYMVMGYLGYKNSVGEGKVRVYIQRLQLTKAEKEALLEYCGYEAKKKARR